MKQQLPFLVLAAALLVSIAQTVIYWPQLPKEMASHFDANGVANGWMSKSGFFATMLGVQFVTAAFLIGLGALLGKLPTSMINIPNREYWLSDERRQETLRDNMQMLAWITALTAVFLVFVFQLTINMNLQKGQAINSVLFWAVLVGYLVVLMTIVLRINSKYAKVPVDG